MGGNTVLSEPEIGNLQRLLIFNTLYAICWRLY